MCVKNLIKVLLFFSSLKKIFFLVKAQPHTKSKGVSYNQACIFMYVSDANIKLLYC